LSEAWRGAMARVGRRTRPLFCAGRHVCDAVHGSLRHQLRLTWLGGTRILDQLEHAQYNVFVSRPALGFRDAPSLAWGALLWRVRSRAEGGTSTQQ
jgi:hypothetical protein